MKPITTFTKPTLNTIRTECDAALVKIAAKYGINAMLLGGSYSDNSFSMKVQFQTKSEIGKQLTSTGFETIPPNGTLCKLNGKTFKVVGYVRSRPAYPMLIEDEKGRRLKCSVDTVERNKI